MSNRYKGGVISATPPTTTGGNDGVASGAWTLEQQMQAQAAGLWPNQPVFYIEDVFSTYLYTGNGSTQTITNGIDLSTKGGLVWIKWRNTTYGSVDHNLYDTSRGVLKRILSNTTDAQVTQASSLTAFNSDGFSLGGTSGTNGNNANYVSWTFREQPKFFDVVTYTGTGSARTVAHNLGSVPGCIIVKATNSSTYWATYHTSLGNTKAIELNTTNSAYTSSAPWNNTSPTSTQFTVGTSTDTNDSGITYIAYLFAHDAGGFGLTGTDNVISCGSFTTDGSGNATVNLGYEPQWVMQKRTDSSTGGNWFIADNMRGMTVDGSLGLFPNLSSAEDTSYQGPVKTNATGFTASRFANATYIYIAIRRGPMKVPTSGTSVFDPEIYTGDNSNTRVITTGFPPDMVWTGTRANGSRRVGDRLRGLFTNPGPISTTSSTSDEQFSSYSSPQMSGWQTGNGTVRFENSTGVDYVLHAFRRAPSFFDEVCYTGTGSQLNVNHNLGSVPELIIVKNRNKSGGENWAVYSATLGAGFFLWLNATDSVRPTYDAGRFPVAPTSSVFTVGSDPDNGGSFNYVAYLFATCAGVSKVGSYTGTATTKQIDCGFTAGSRFVMIKRTDSTGDWYVWDSARGIVAGDDPYLLLNSTAAEVTNTDYVDTYSAGFEISSTAPAAINANGGTFIFLAIA